MSALQPGSRRRIIGLVSGAALVAAATIPAAEAAPNNNTSRKLREAVTVQGVTEHLQAFDRIGKANGNTRASGTSGYAQSRDYVVSKLRAAGYSPTVQEFDFPFYREKSTPTLQRTAPTPTTYTAGTDFATMTYSASGDITRPVTPVDVTIPPATTANSSTSGCESTDFAGFTAGNIALVQRGTCPFAQKAQNAQTAGAAAVIVFNEGQDGRTGVVAGTLSAPGITIPVLGTSFALGREWATTPGTTLRVKTDTESAIRKTWNVLAETKAGDAANVVMAGAHLDSVIPGPGVNDNGSGSAAILEVAEQMAKVKPVNKVRFAWWGAEELGLLGSKHYVSDLKAKAPAQLKAIALYLNFDMVASPNYGLFVYDGNNSKFPVGPGAAAGPKGSAEIEKMFHDYFAGQNTPSGETAFSGRSDYGPFIEQGVPAGGLFTGAEGVKTAEEAALWGGTAGVAYDKCYHLACDDISNISKAALDANSDAIAHAVLTYAMDTRSVNGTGKGHPVSPPGQHTDSGPGGSGTGSGGGLHDDHDHELPSS